MRPAPKRVLIAGLGVALFGLSLVGLLGPLAERFMLAFNREKLRPVLLHFGALAAVGHCNTRETDDPTSDILGNVIDVDGDGHPDYRLSANSLGTHVTCEQRRFGLWLDRPSADCTLATSACEH